ncbi:hypothetical protein MNO11_21535 [Serratia plymuthica]|uniref:hypothetical protein n=1 Tax=Serratia plymuthica TaxID=82996 RepID=UPI001F53370A|nr:hypothetical protein [Serratia plymuthica]UNK27362.1 hypothetical protein MNO11_21535 [Serratia plymuthica]
MTESEMEKKMLNNGFTAKNISHMRKIISRDDTQKETYSSLLKNLKKRFFSGCFICAIFLTVLIVFILKYSISEVSSYLIVMFFGLYATYYIIPMNLAWKSYRYLYKEE